MRAGAISSMNDSSEICSVRRLVPQHRVIEADAVGHLEVIGRIERDALVAARQRDRAHDFQEPLRRREPLEARFVNQVNERRGAAVHDGHFGMVQLDDDVVHAQADERGQQVLDGLDRAVLQRKAGGVLDAAQVRDRGGNLEAAQVRRGGNECRDRPEPA